MVTCAGTDSVEDYISEISALLRKATERAEAEAYKRGREDERREILAMIGGTMAAAAQQRQDSKPSFLGEAYAKQQSDLASNEDYSTRQPEDRKRAPKGIVPKFLRRVLTAHPGLTPAEIAEYRSGTYEAMIRPDSIRGELSTGARKGRYRTEAGKWFLVGEAGGQTLTSEPPASSRWDDDDAASID